MQVEAASQFLTLGELVFEPFRSASQVAVGLHVSLHAGQSLLALL